MITIMELLSFPLFHNFELATDASGLYNTVSGTGIFEWEMKEDIDATFEPGEFVMTTLSSAKEDIHTAKDGLLALIEKGVSAIAVKKVYFSEISADLVDFANDHHVPIFLFSDTFFDDIIYTVKHALVSNDLNSVLTKALETLLEAPCGTEEAGALAKEINPFFYNNAICCYCSPKEQGEATLDDFYSYYLGMTRKEVDAAQTAHLLIRYKFGVLIIFTRGDSSEKLRSGLLSLLSYLELQPEDFHIGISSCEGGLSYLSNKVRESIYACLSSLLSGKSLLDYEDIGLNQFLFPLRNDPWINRMYDRFESTLSQYDQKHNSNLFATLVEYVRNGGDVPATADKMYQHGNTIRYRLDKIKSILKIHDADDAYSQLYIFARLYEIRQLLCDVNI